MNVSYGKYQVLEQVGEGGFGRVFRALDPLLKRDVAIKTCTLRNAEVRARFVREAEIVAGLKHPNIVTVYDFGVEDGEPYLVQEFLTGADLQQVLESGVPVDAATKVRWLRQIAAGLLHAHGKGVVHRDIKPSNIRIEDDGNVRIMDFGIARLMEAEQQLTQTGMSIGTTGYLAPEQITGESIDHRADIFSFGVLAYELVSGRRPFAADTMSAGMYRVLHDDPVPLPELVPECPPRLAACIARCLEKERDRRWSSMSLVIDALDTIQGVTPATAPTPETAAARTGEVPAGRRFSATTAGFLTVAVALALFGVITVTRTAWSGPRTQFLVDGGSASGTDRDAAGGDAVSDPAPVASSETLDTPAADAVADSSVAAHENSAASSDGQAATTATDAETRAVSPPPAGQALDPNRLVLIVRADVGASFDPAESVILEELRSGGFVVVDGEMVDATAGSEPASPNALAALGRRHGAGHLIVADVTSNAVASVGGMYTGSASVRVRAYDATSGGLGGDATGAVGSGGVPGKLAATPEAAEREAVKAAAYQAARRLVNALPR